MVKAAKRQEDSVRQLTFAQLPAYEREIITKAIKAMNTAESWVEVDGTALPDKTRDQGEQTVLPAKSPRSPGTDPGIPPKFLKRLKEVASPQLVQYFQNVPQRVHELLKAVPQHLVLNLIRVASPQREGGPLGYAPPQVLQDLLKYAPALKTTARSDAKEFEAEMRSHSGEGFEGYDESMQRDFTILRELLTALATTGRLPERTESAGPFALDDLISTFEAHVEVRAYAEVVNGRARIIYRPRFNTGMGRVAFVVLRLSQLKQPALLICKESGEFALTSPEGKKPRTLYASPQAGDRLRFRKWYWSDQLSGLKERLQTAAADPTTNPLKLTKLRVRIDKARAKQKELAQTTKAVARHN